jgi:hypothetical protein
MFEGPTFDRGDHTMSESLESDPSLYKVSIYGDKKKVLEYLKRGNRLSLSVNMSNYSVFIGEDHMSQQVANHIDNSDLAAGYVRMNPLTGQVGIEDFADWRKDESASNNRGAKGAIEKKIQEYLATQK